MKKVFVIRALSCVSLVLLVSSIISNESRYTLTGFIEQKDTEERKERSITYSNLLKQTIEHQFSVIKQEHVRLQRNEKIFYGTVVTTALGLYLYNNREGVISRDILEKASKLVAFDAFIAAGGKLSESEKEAGFIKNVHFCLSPVYAGAKFFKNSIFPGFIGSLMSGGLFAIKNKMTGVFSLDYALHNSYSWYGFIKVEPLVKAQILSTNTMSSQSYKEAVRTLQLFEETMQRFFSIVGTTIAYIQYQQEVINSANVVYVCDQVAMNESLIVITEYATTYAALLDDLIAQYKNGLHAHEDAAQLTDKKTAIIMALSKFTEELLKPEIKKFEEEQSTLVHQSCQLNQTWLHMISSMVTPFIDTLLFKPAVKEVLCSSKIKIKI